MPTIQIHYYNGLPTGHINLSIVDGAGATPTVRGFNDVTFINGGSFATAVDELAKYNEAGRVGARIDSAEYSVTAEQLNQILSRVSEYAVSYSQYTLFTDDNPANGMNCAEFVYYLTKDIVTNYGDLFAPEDRSRMTSPVTLALKKFTSSENLGDFPGGQNPYLDNHTATIPIPGYDRTAGASQGYGAASAAVNSLSPLVLDLDGGGIQTTAVNRYGAHFDLDANGFAESVGWVAPGDGLLVRDLDGDGVIDNGRELFGDHTVLQNGNNAANGFQALAELDGNADGKVDANDAAFASLRVWRDIGIAA